MGRVVIVCYCIITYIFIPNVINYHYNCLRGLATVPVLVGRDRQQNENLVTRLKGTLLCISIIPRFLMLLIFAQILLHMLGRSP